MSIKLDKQERDRRTTLVNELRDGAAKLEDAVSQYNADVQEARTKLDTAIETYNEIVSEARGFAEDIASRIDGEIDDKSERWQEGERGEAARSFKDEWEGIDITDIEIDDHEDLELGDVDHAETLEGLPEEPEQ